MSLQARRPSNEFERRVYECARASAMNPMSRRALAKGFGAAGAAAVLGPGGALAAPITGPLVARARYQDGPTTLRIARGQLTDSLDAQKTSALVAHEIMWQIYDSLIYLDEQGTVHPGLATEWTFSDDNLTVTYTLREGVNFHDGTPFNAEVVQATVARHLDPATASPTA